jgi:selenoprotein W-related protein
LTSKLLSTYKQQLAELRLVPSGGGCFELSADGKPIYSKLETGKFPNEQEMIDEVGKRLRATARR